MEILDLVDAHGIPTGEVADRRLAHRGGLRHRTAHVWIVRERENRVQALLQKRSLAKDSFPGCLDTSSAGHIPAGCEPVPSALRELREELGVAAAPEELTPIGRFDIRYERTFHGALFRDNEVAFVYLLRRDMPETAFVPQPEELDSVVWQDVDDIAAAIGRHDPAYCVPPGGLRLLREWLARKAR